MAATAGIDVSRHGTGASEEAARVWPSARTAWYGVFMLALVSAFAQMDRGIITLLVQPIKRHLLLSDTEISLLIGLAFSVTYMMLGLPISRLADTRSRKTIISCGLAVWSLATAACGLAQTFLQFFFCRGLVGAAESVKGPCSLSMISDYLPKEKLPRAFALYNCGIVGGMAASLLLGGALIGWLADKPPVYVPGFGYFEDWQAVFVIVGLPGALVAAIIMLTVPEPARHGRRVAGSVPVRDVVKFVWRQRGLHLPLLLALAAGSIENAGGVWRAAFYERTFGWGPERIGPLLGFSMLIGAPIGLFLGAALTEWMAKRRYEDANIRILFIAQMASLPFAVLSPLMPSPWLALGAGMLASVLGNMGAPGQLAAIQVITPNEMRGQVSALYLFTIGVIGGGLGPTLVALVTDFVFADESLLRFAMSGNALFWGALAMTMSWIGLGPYRAAYRAANA